MSDMGILNNTSATWHPENNGGFFMSIGCSQQRGPGKEGQAPWRLGSKRRVRSLGLQLITDQAIANPAFPSDHLEQGD